MRFGKFEVIVVVWRSWGEIVIRFDVVGMINLEGNSIIREEMVNLVCMLVTISVIHVWKII